MAHRVRRSQPHRPECREHGRDRRIVVRDIPRLPARGLARDLDGDGRRVPDPLDERVRKAPLARRRRVDELGLHGRASGIDRKDHHAS
jgi:hypothetical protein